MTCDLSVLRTKTYDFKLVYFFGTSGITIFCIHFSYNKILAEKGNIYNLTLEFCERSDRGKVNFSAFKF